MPRAPKQPYFSEAFKPRAVHGGGLRAGRRKLARPIDPKRAIHVTYRATAAKGALSFLHPKNVRRVNDTVRQVAGRYGVRIYQYANNGNHLHLLVRGKTRKSIQDFLRAIGSRVSQLVTGACKGRAFGKFWDALAFTRIVDWGRAFHQARFYVLKNQLEAEGVILHVRERPGRGKGEGKPSRSYGRPSRSYGRPWIPFPAEWGEGHLAFT